LRDHSEPTPPPGGDPWLPFSSREDFEFTEFVHQAMLNKKQVDRLIKFIKHCQEKPGKFTFRNYEHLKAVVDGAKDILTPVRVYQPPASNKQ
jgi:hypothetical protein